ncbi:MAG: Ribonuclease Y [Candidatus Woesebacteria bacterium GW2011_GWA1_38_8]|uniref:Ribonuclease Y n=1 Tax=Candidatus Woesebacteria bacterium GW2011_GWA1_38_8 TaxID=1618547 RepID=A0A0G0KWH4_9BACT|nr:MAG: Ribonuclease Y [Candidatus Woesebacteria bacterium GW2011_GWA1_38_8]
MTTANTSDPEKNTLLKKREEQIEKKEKEILEKLSKVAKLSQDEARKMLLSELQKDLTEEIAKKIRSAEERIKLESGEKAREILAEAMRHAATSYTAESYPART